MGCCVGFAASKALIEAVVSTYYPNDYKLFVANRTAEEGIGYRLTVGVVVMPDMDKNTQLFEALVKLHTRSDACIRVLSSQIENRGDKIMDLFLLEVSTEVTLEETP